MSDRMQLTRTANAGTRAPGGLVPRTREREQRAPGTTAGRRAGVLTASAGREVQDVVRSRGEALDPSVVAVLGPRFHFDLSHVRVHADDRAARSARALDATAYAVGHHVVFGDGGYRPRTSGGLRLLAHELSHVVPRASNTPPAATMVSDPTSPHEREARAAAAELGSGGRSRVAEHGVVYRQSPAASGSITPEDERTPEHRELSVAAAQFTASDLEFGFLDVAAWKTDPAYLDSFKDNFVYANRQIIVAAAARYDLPAELVAGVVRVEIGGKDPIKPLVYQWRNWVPYSADRDTTSLGQQAMQPRRAAASLGYDPKALTPAQHDAILSTLRDKSQSIFLAAKHLSDLRTVDSPGTAGSALTAEQIEVIGARYNQGPERPLEEVRRDLSYGRAITRRWATLGALLTTGPKPLEYAPIGHGLIDPLNRAVYQLESNIYRLYDVPHF